MLQVGMKANELVTFRKRYVSADSTVLSKIGESGCSEVVAR